MKIKVYQINSKRDKKRIKFRGYDETVKAQDGLPLINRSIYDEVFSGEVECKTLSDIYVLLNYGRCPAEYKGHSLSVSDIIQTNGEFHFVDKVGFQKVEFTTLLD